MVSLPIGGAVSQVEDCRVITFRVEQWALGGGATGTGAIFAVSFEKPKISNFSPLDVFPK